MKKIRIVCVGNSLVPEDAAGLHVFNELCSRSCSIHVEIVNGALGGMDLLPFFFGCDTVVLVDRVIGFAEAGSVLKLDRETFCAGWQGTYSPASELLYLLKSLPYLGIDPMPTVWLIGIEGAGGEVVKRAADMALEAAGET